MGLADDMKRFGEEMIDSYQQRIKENKNLVTEVQNTLDGFRKAHQDMADKLRTHLDQEESNRQEEFDGMMTGIHNIIADITHEVNEIRNDTHSLLQNLNKIHHSKTASFKEKLNHIEGERQEEFEGMMNGIHNVLSDISHEVNEIRNNTHSMLQGFNEDHHFMASSLKEKFRRDQSIRKEEFNEIMTGVRNVISNITNEVEKVKSSSQTLLNEFGNDRNVMAENLRNGHQNSERIEEFQTTMQNIRNEVLSVKDFTSGLLNDFRKENAQMADSRRNYLQMIANMRSNQEIPLMPESEKEEEKKPKSKRQKQANGKVAETNDREPLAKPLTVEDKVLDYINTHPDGVRVSEMEAPIGEQRMKLGYVAKRLLDDGKVMKQDNVYYPVTHADI
ncbi:MAG: hypothetical protein ACEPOZ_19390 [Marinifilaceae bacterium]